MFFTVVHQKIVALIVRRSEFVYAFLLLPTCMKYGSFVFKNINYCIKANMTI